MKKIEKFLTIAMNKIADTAGKPIVFLGIILLTIAWFVCSRFIEYQTWFDIMDVTIFVSTFLMIFILQASQNADTEAIQDKLDEIIDALPKARKSKEGEEYEFKHGRKTKR